MSQAANGPPDPLHVGALPAWDPKENRESIRRRSRAGCERRRREDRTMAISTGRAAEYGRTALEAAAEALWPTRCAVCDVPGAVLCDSCRANLPYIDWWRACRRCGAPFGRVQCSECNLTLLGAQGRTRPPFDSCASVVTFAGAPALIVRTFKDRGERRLAAELAASMARIAHPLWIDERPTIVGIPATARAVRRRGFDHAELLAREISAMTGLPFAQPLSRPRTADQRGLNRRERAENMAKGFSVLPGASIPERVLLVDDVFTTGATLFAATDALVSAGARKIRCLTYARAW